MEEIASYGAENGEDARRVAFGMQGCGRRAGQTGRGPNQDITPPLTRGDDCPSPLAMTRHIAPGR